MCAWPTEIGFKYHQYVIVVKKGVSSDRAIASKFGMILMPNKSIGYKYRFKNKH